MEDKMTFQFLVESCYASFQGEKVTKKLAEDIVRNVFEDVRDALVSGRTVSVRNFGTFKVVEKKGRIYVEPREQKTIEVGPGRYPKFEASRGLKKAVKEQ